MEDLKTEEMVNQELRSDDDYVKYLTFKQGNELYGIVVSSVKEVIDYTHVTKVPRAPQYIRGVINLRGDVVPLVDISSLFYNEKNEITKLTCIVIVEVDYDDNNKVMIGMLIDAINSVADISSKDIELPPEFGAKIPVEYISGVGKIENKFVILLNVNKALDINELSRFNKEEQGINNSM
ncbi:MAG: chemotaxis protein CheW [Spirochaetota bacterium]|nr:chemotaxis protein CheW [Spirochaetota bacterium]